MIYLCQMPFVNQLISFQLLNHHQTRLKLKLLVKTNIDLLNDYLENLIDNFFIRWKGICLVTNYPSNDLRN